MRLDPAAPVLLAMMFAVAGMLHFAVPGAYERIVPRWLPAPRLLVYLSGAAEIAGAIALLPVGTRRAAGWGLILLLAAVFPANVQMLQDARAAGAGRLAMALLWARLPLQPLLMWWVWSAAVRGR